MAAMAAWEEAEKGRVSSSLWRTSSWRCMTARSWTASRTLPMSWGWRSDLHQRVEISRRICVVFSWMAFCSVATSVYDSCVGDFMTLAWESISCWSSFHSFCMITSDCDCVCTAAAAACCCCCCC